MVSLLEKYAIFEKKQMMFFPPPNLLGTERRGLMSTTSPI